MATSPAANGTSALASADAGAEGAAAATAAGAATGAGAGAPLGAPLGALLGALLAIGSSFFLGSPLPYSLLGVGLFVAMLFTHRGNIERLLKKKENTV